MLPNEVMEFLQNCELNNCSAQDMRQSSLADDEALVEQPIMPDTSNTSGDVQINLGPNTPLASPTVGASVDTDPALIDIGGMAPEPVQSVNGSLKDTTQEMQLNSFESLAQDVSPSSPSNVDLMPSVKQTSMSETPNSEFEIHHHSETDTLLLLNGHYPRV